MSSYLVLGSGSGTTPGIGLGAITLPLNPDPYLSWTLAFPNAAPLAMSSGTLDASGRGQAVFSIPPGLSASLIGLPLDHAFVTYTSLGIDFASNAVPVTFTQ